MEALAIPRVERITGEHRSRVAWVVVISEFIRLTLASVLLCSGLAKLRAPYEFLGSIYGYELTGPLLSLVIATVLPWLEVIVAICLWGKLLYRGALIVAVMLTFMFSSVLGIALYRQLDISCGCFMASDKISYMSLARSVALLVAAIVGLWLAIRARKAAAG